MKHLLIVGTSEQSARNLALDLLESRNEEITMNVRDRIKTASDTMCVVLPVFRVTYEAMRGLKFDEVHLIGDLDAVQVEAVKEAVFNSGIGGSIQSNYVVHAVEPMGLRIKK